MTVTALVSMRDSSRAFLQHQWLKLTLLLPLLPLVELASLQPLPLTFLHLQGPQALRYLLFRDKKLFPLRVLLPLGHWIPLPPPIVVFQIRWHSTWLAKMDQISRLTSSKPLCLSMMRFCTACSHSLTPMCGMISLCLVSLHAFHFLLICINRVYLANLNWNTYQGTLDMDYRAQDPVLYSGLQQQYMAGVQH